jgi:anaerobic magnesium-protoporphyrin IX monomethyl ester cyclase
LDPDFSILEQHSKIENFVTDPFTRPDFVREARTYQPHRRGQKMSTVLTAKGCVSRCTFCHRWDKGYRPFPVDMIVRRIKYLKDRYNVGFISFGDENFGSDHKQVEDLIIALKPLDILYQVGGVRCRTVDPGLLSRMHDSGCVGLYYGMETGSPRMLEVMEKNASLEANINAAKWTWANNLSTIYQMVIAMPGENHETINETLDFIKKVTEDLEEPPHKMLSINYIQALPGTAVYEYARETGLIEKTLEGEDAYLTQVSDVNASDDTKFINFTEYDYFTVQSWRRRLLFEAEVHYYRHRNWKPSTYRLPNGALPEDKDYYTEGSYFNLKKVVHGMFFYRYLYPLRHMYVWSYVLWKSYTAQSSEVFWSHVLEFFKYRFKKHKGLKDYRSLRRVVKDIAEPAATETDINMQPLRAGR